MVIGTFDELLNEIVARNGKQAAIIWLQKMGALEHERMTIHRDYPFSMTVSQADQISRQKSAAMFYRYARLLAGIET